MHIYVDIWPIGMSRSELFEARCALQDQPAAYHYTHKDENGNPKVSRSTRCGFIEYNKESTVRVITRSPDSVVGGFN